MLLNQIEKQKVVGQNFSVFFFLPPPTNCWCHSVATGCDFQLHPAESAHHNFPKRNTFIFVMLRSPIG